MEGGGGLDVHADGGWGREGVGEMGTCLDAEILGKVGTRKAEKWERKEKTGREGMHTGAGKGTGCGTDNGRGPDGIMQAD